MFNIDDETRRRMLASTDLLFDQLKRCPIDNGELSRVLTGLDLANVGDVSAVIGASELMLRDPEELADALLKYGLPSDRIIEILIRLDEQEIELSKVFEECYD
jgi:hypothetical protein